MPPLSLPSVEDVKKLRKKIGLTQSELARLADVSQSLVSQIESGEVDPRLSTLKRILEALNKEETEEEIFAEDLFAKDLIYVSPDDLVTQAASTMWANYISQLPVIKNGKNLGSISEKSITAEIAKGSTHNLTNKTIKEIMQEPFPMVGKRTRMEVLLSLLQDNLAILVLDDGKISGIVTKADVLQHLKTGKPGGEGDQPPSFSNSSR